ncbi:MAG: carbonate dehydratase [bacterium]|nr:carbonate dehydratase [bacterium]
MGIEPNGTGDHPTISGSAYIHPSAVIIGNVQILDEVFVGPQAVIRADEPDADGVVAPIIIGERSNVQDCVVVHALAGTSVKIGPEASIAHGAVVHGPCELGSNTFVGFSSVVFNATLGDGVVVMHRALVEGVDVPSGMYVPSAGAVRCEHDVRALAPVPEDVAAFARKVVRTNVALAESACGREGD